MLVGAVHCFAVMQGLMLLHHRKTMNCTLCWNPYLTNQSRRRILPLYPFQGGMGVDL